MGDDCVVSMPSDTASRTVYCPACAYVCVGFAAVEVVPSPNVHEYVSGLPLRVRSTPRWRSSRSSGTGPEVGVAAATATGGWFPPLMNRIRRILLIPAVFVVSEYPRST